MTHWLNVLGIDHFLYVQVELHLENSTVAIALLMAPEALPFSSLQSKQRPLQQYQLYMQEANKGIYSPTNSLTEGPWMEEISMWKRQQNSVVQQLKSNLMGLELGKLLD